MKNFMWIWEIAFTTLTQEETENISSYVVIRDFESTVKNLHTKKSSDSGGFTFEF